MAAEIRRAYREAARQVLRLATMGSAAALHRENELGSLEAGKRADVITVDLSGPSAFPLFDPYSHLVYAAHASSVRTTVVEGRVLMEDGRVRTLDTAAIRRAASRYARRISAAIKTGPLSSSGASALKRP